MSSRYNIKAVSFLVLFSVTAGATDYTTSFPATENPISESSNWTNGLATGLDWSDCRTTPGKAFGTQSQVSIGGFNDSTALLKGSWGVTQQVTATVFLTEGAGQQEVEIRLRSKLSAHVCNGYEILWEAHSSGYASIVRWNGTLGDFTYLNQTPLGGYTGLHNGDQVRAAITNSTISSYVNYGSGWVLVMTATDSTYTTGQPGMGFWINSESASAEANYGFTTWTATDGAASSTTTGTGFSGGPISGGTIRTQ